MSAPVGYERFEVTVPDGTLRVGRWGAPVGGAPVILALHGITASHMAFLALADQLGSEVTLIAPDLRGRGGSRGITGPYSMAHHADDAAAVLDAVGVDRALVVGHSMGGFAAVVLADRHRDRVSRVVLMDGGIPLDLPEALLAMPVDQLITAVLGPAAERLQATFPTREAYLDFWRPHPALAGAWGPYVEAYLDYDLVGEAPELRPSCLVEALLGDSESELVADDIPVALEHLRHPTILLRAPRGILDGDPLYTEAWLDQWAAKVPGELRWTTVPDVNHYTLGLAPHGARAVADTVRAELAERSGG